MVKRKSKNCRFWRRCVVLTAVREQASEQPLAYVLANPGVFPGIHSQVMNPNIYTMVRKQPAFPGCCSGPIDLAVMNLSKLSAKGFEQT